MGATRPQTPRRSPRQAFGGNSGSRPQGGKLTKSKTLTNPQNFSYEVSHLRGHGTMQSMEPSLQAPPRTGCLKESQSSLCAAPGHRSLENRNRSNHTKDVGLILAEASTRRHVE